MGFMAKHGKLPRGLAGQSALEFIFNYAWAFIIIAIVLGAIIYLSTLPSTIIPTQCYFGYGISCKGMTIGSLNGVTHINMIFINAQPYDIVGPTNAIFDISGYGPITATCNPSNAISGGAILCGGGASESISTTTLISGTMTVNTEVCLTGTSSNCQSTRPTTYIGNFSGYVGGTTSNLPTNVLLLVSSQNTNAGTEVTLTAEATILGLPVQGGTVSFSTNMPAYSTVAPEYALTSDNGNAISYFTASAGGSYEVNAMFAGLVSSNVITVTGPPQNPYTSASSTIPTSSSSTSTIPASSTSTTTIPEQQIKYVPVTISNNPLPFNSVPITITNPALVEYYTILTVQNRQTIATPAPFQQELQIDSAAYSSYINPQWSNVEFTSGAPANSGGTVLQAWVESGNTNTATSTVVWVKLPNGIAAQSSMQVYMNFMPYNVMSDTGPTGEAPQLSTNYGSEDNGQYVFEQYGGGGPNGWNSFTFVGGSWSDLGPYNLYPTALTQTSSASIAGSDGGPTALIEGTSYPASGSYVIEEAFSFTAVSGQTPARTGIITVATPTSNPDTFGYRFMIPAYGMAFLNDYVSWVQLNSYGGSGSTPYTMQITDNAGYWSGNLYSGYGVSSSPITSLSSSPIYYVTNNYEGQSSGYVGISASYCGSPCDANPVTVQWFRMRALPPADIMPSCTSGCSSAGSISTVNINVATPAPFQQMLTIDSAQFSQYINSQWSNVEFTSGAPANSGGTVLQAWVESGASNSATSTVVWVNLPSGIPGGGSATIYMNIMPYNVMSNTGPTGEAPEISSADGSGYATFDNGALVFNYYTNFAGTAMPSGWNTAETSGLNVNNGVSFTGASTGGNAAQIVYTTAVSEPFAMDAYLYSGPSTNNPTISLQYVNTYGSAFSSGYTSYQQVGSSTGCTGQYNNIIKWSSSTANNCFITSATTVPVSSYGISTLMVGDGVYTKSEPIVSMWNYGDYVAGIDGSYNNYYPAVGSWWNDKTTYIEWFRLRAYPPYGNMPSASVGSSVSSGSLSIATPAPFQQELQIPSYLFNGANEIDSNWGNVEFTSGGPLGTGTALQAWVENSPANNAADTVVWVNLPNGIPGGGSATIYMNFLPSNIMTQSGPTGEAPELSSTYGEYDNGADVFNFYDNFLGGTLNSRWSTCGSSHSVNDGVTLGSLNAIYATLSPSSTGLIIDSYFKPVSIGTDLDYELILGYGGAAAGSYCFANSGYGGYFGGNTGSTAYGITKYVSNSQNGMGYVTSSAASDGVPYINTLEWGGDTLTHLYNYGNAYTGTDTTYSLSQATQIFIAQYGVSSPSSTTYWVRERAYPPGGVMPTASYGAVSSVTLPYYSTIVLDNSQSSATPAPFQQLVNINSNTYSKFIEPGWLNVEFTTGPAGTGTVLYAWLESGNTNTATSTNIWVKVPNGLPSGLSQIYMDYLPSNAYYDSSVNPSGTTGWAPQLSTNYGENDNGAQVFNYYQNFAGSSLPAGWSTSGGPSYSVNDGLTITGGGSADDYIASTSTYSQPIAVDYYGTLSAASGCWTEGGLITSASNNYGTFVQAAGGADIFGQQNGASGYSSSGTLLSGTSGTGVWTVMALSGTTSDYQYNYGTIQAVTSDAPTYPLNLGAFKSSAGCSSLSPSAFVQWMRTRALPPNGVMPAASVSTAIQ